MCEMFIKHVLGVGENHPGLYGNTNAYYGTLEFLWQKFKKLQMICFLNLIYILAEVLNLMKKHLKKIDLAVLINMEIVKQDFLENYLHKLKLILKLVL